jgi:integral membrane protein (TIGR01906 family)
MLRHGWRTAAVVFIAVCVLPVAALSALRIVTNDWIVHFELDHGALPRDRYGMTNDERRSLALFGLDSIRPGGEGIGLLRGRRLEDGEVAFKERELAHMQDVRDIVGFAFRVHLVLVALLVISALGLGVRPSTRGIVPRGLQLGAVATLGFAALVGVVMAVAWKPFFDGFHNLFFEGRTWHFESGDTLLRVYPNAFWVGVAVWIAIIAIAFAAVTLAVTTLWLRRVSPPRRRGGETAF